MKSITLILGLVILALASSALPQDAQPRKTFDHGMLDALLIHHVKGDAVDYSGLLRDRAMLDAYTGRLSAVSPAQLATYDSDERFAFWINAYNAFTLKLIVDNYAQPGGKHLTSIMDLTKDSVSPWDQPSIPMAAHLPLKKDEAKPFGLTLGDIENRILRPIYKDARLHAAINCASVSCPPLRAEAFTGAQLGEQLQQQMTSFIADAARNQIDGESRKVALSQIFNWYAVDFEDKAKGTTAVDYIAGFLAESDWIKTAKPSFLEYDWKLNDFAKK